MIELEALERLVCATLEVKELSPFVSKTYYDLLCISFGLAKDLFLPMTEVRLSRIHTREGGKANEMVGICDERTTRAVAKDYASMKQV